MEFRILGHVEVLDGGRELPIGGGRQRALLAALLIHPNELVSADRLIDAIWAEEPPANPENALQALVSRLRRTLGDGRLEHRATGYLLHVALGERDIDRFLELHARGELDAALALWRGRPLAVSPRATDARGRAGNRTWRGAARARAGDPAPRTPPPAGSATQASRLRGCRRRCRAAGGDAGARARGRVRLGPGRRTRGGDPGRPLRSGARGGSSRVPAHYRDQRRRRGLDRGRSRTARAHRSRARPRRRHVRGRRLLDRGAGRRSTRRLVRRDRRQREHYLPARPALGCSRARIPDPGPLAARSLGSGAACARRRQPLGVERHDEADEDRPADAQAEDAPARQRQWRGVGLSGRRLEPQRPDGHADPHRCEAPPDGHGPDARGERRHARRAALPDQARRPRRLGLDRRVWGTEPRPVDERTNAVVAQIHLGHRPNTVAAGPGVVWVASGDGTLQRIDPRSNRIVRTMRLDASPRGLALVGGRLFVALAQSLPDRRLGN